MVASAVACVLVMSTSIILAGRSFLAGKAEGSHGWQWYRKFKVAIYADAGRLGFGCET